MSQLWQQVTVNPAEAGQELISFFIGLKSRDFKIMAGRSRKYNIRSLKYL
jgi:hypothetical protein